MGTVGGMIAQNFMQQQKYNCSFWCQMADADVELGNGHINWLDDDHLLEDIKVPKDEASHNEEEFSKILELDRHVNFTF